MFGLKAILYLFVSGFSAFIIKMFSDIVESKRHHQNNSVFKAHYDFGKKFEMVDTPTEEEIVSAKKKKILISDIRINKFSI